jgi:aspartyl-tRNA(Asn)/glutamyl-tRNA(Gln) amidotransferase subunit A
MTLSPTLDTVGILGKHVQDVQLILNILTEVPLQDIAPAHKIAYWIPEQLLSQTIFNGLTQFILTRFPKVDEINFTDFEIYRKATELIFSYELNQQFSNRLDDPTITKTIRSICKRAQYISPEQYLEYLHSLTQHRQQFIDQYLTDHDLIIIPCFSCSLPDWQEVEIGHPQFHQEKLMGLFHLMGFINYLGLPAISIPIGLDANHRPLSVQVISRPLMEKNLLEFAQQILA